MANNTTINVGQGGSVIRDIDRSGVKTQVAQLDMGGLAGEILVVAGQKNMASSLPVTMAVNQPAILIAQAIAVNIWGQAIAVSANSTATIVSIASSAAGFQIKGVVATGTGDGRWSLQIANVTILSGRTRASAPNLLIVLPNGVLVSTGSLVEFKVTNEAGSTADYEATLLGA